MVQLADILGLSVAERIAMAEAIWDSIKKEEVSLSAAQLDELDFRMALHDSGEMPYVSWDDVKAELRNRR
ncbi:addiction module protein [Parapedobacter sp. DT-150]|uniref:addiction module protein n=1 Tax=Parapedobacter sp. DT-150 TaxID=3396162 RepID=UPI003F1E2364